MSGDSGWEHNGACAKGGLSEGGEGHKDCQVNKDRPGEYTWDESVFLEEKKPHHFRQAFWYGKGVRPAGITKKNFKIGTLGDFEKTYVLYVAMAEKPLSSGQKWFLR